MRSSSEIREAYQAKKANAETSALVSQEAASKASAAAAAAAERLALDNRFKTKKKRKATNLTGDAPAVLGMINRPMASATLG